MMKVRMGKLLKILLILLLLVVIFSQNVNRVMAGVYVNPADRQFSGMTPQVQYQDSVFGVEDLNLQKTGYYIQNDTWNHMAFLMFGCVTNSCYNAIGGGATGAIGGSIQLIGYLYENKPASGVEYLASVGERLKIVRPAYAQTTGTGFVALQPIQGLWKTFRNIAYFFFVLIFLVIGLAIMFRVKISPQAVVTVQSAIPKIVIALILVTFSYAIAGFMIDLTYVAMDIIGTIFSAEGRGVWINDLDAIVGSAISGDRLSDMNILSFALLFFSNGFNAAKQATDVINPLSGAYSGATGIFEDLLRGISFLSPLGAGQAVLLVVLGIALLFTFFRLFFILLISYVSVLISIIFSPFQIMLTALPGGNGFGDWLRGLVANLSVFPATLVMLALASTLGGDQSGNLWVPAPIAPPGAGAGPSAETVMNMVALGILFLTPQVANMIKDAIKAPQFKYGASILAPVGAAAGIAAFLPRQITETVSGGIQKAGQERVSKWVGEIGRARASGGASAPTGRRAHFE